MSTTSNQDDWAPGCKAVCASSGRWRDAWLHTAHIQLNGGLACTVFIEALNTILGEGDLLAVS
jgi:hypothetical protein